MLRSRAVEKPQAGAGQGSQVQRLQKPLAGDSHHHPLQCSQKETGAGSRWGRGGSQTSLVKSKAVEVKSQMQPGHESGLGTNGILGFVQLWDRGCKACVFSQGLDTG